MNNLNLIAPVGMTGYGVTGFQILKTLSERGWDISLFPRGPSGRDAIEKQLVIFSSDRATYFEYDAPCLNIWHPHDLSLCVGRGKYVAWSIFELDTFDEKERHNLGYPDELIVCSKWAKEVCRKNNIESPIHIVPLGIDSGVFNLRVTPSHDTKDTTVFLNVGKWEIRKGHDILGEVFNKAFTPEDNVELWLLPHNPFLSKQDQHNWEHMYQDTPMGKSGKIKIYPWQNSQHEVAKIMMAASCGIFPSRGEGWNLELLEMMALGKPVIATNYSAHTEYCDEYNCMLIDITDTEPAFDGKWFFEQGDWAQIGDTQIQQLIDYMQAVHKKCKLEGSFVNKAGIETAHRLTWDNSIDILEQIFE